MISNPVNSLKIAKRVADPVHGLIRLTEIEAQVLQHPSFQRLRNITQLGMAKYVYPGSTHNRFSHSLGVLHNVTEMFDVAYRNWIRSPNLVGDINEDVLFSEQSLQMTRLAAMCHDLGHFPFSHNLENAMDWLFEKKLIPKTFRHEHLSAIIIRYLLEHILGEYTDPVANLIDGDYSDFGSCLFPVFLVSSAIDADRMDYLIRDANHCGVGQGYYDKERLLDSLVPYSITLHGKSYDVLSFRAKGIEAIEQFLMARHRMHQTVYFNPSVVGFEAGLRRAYYRITTEDPPWDLPSVYLENPEKFLEFDEGEFFVQLKKKLKEKKSWLADPIISRTPLQKVGPFYLTLKTNNHNSQELKEKYSQLQKVKDELEIPSQDWYRADNWVYIEHKKQVLVDSFPKTLATRSEGNTDTKLLKNVILLINSKGEVIDPTDEKQGHTFLPFITGHEYHRFIFFTHKDHGKRLLHELDEISQYYSI